jgi:histidinol-phosphate phosphatase family protein
VSGRRAAVFLDRDGVLNELVLDPELGRPESPLQTSDVRLIPGAAEGAAALKAAGYVLVCVTNQPAAAKGKASLSELEAIQRSVREKLSANGAELDAWRMCPHHPNGVVSELSGPCDCRKPAPGMLLDAAQDLHLDLSRSWLIGDTAADVAAGRAAGCRTILIDNPSSAHKRSEADGSDFVAADLRDASAQLLALRRSC